MLCRSIPVSLKSHGVAPVYCKFFTGAVAVQMARFEPHSGNPLAIIAWDQWIVEKELKSALKFPLFAQVCSFHQLQELLAHSLRVLYPRLLFGESLQVLNVV